MTPITWQVISHWARPGGTEYVRVAEFGTHDEARQEVCRLAPLIGELTASGLLKSLRIAGDFDSLAAPGRAGAARA